MDAQNSSFLFAWDCLDLDFFKEHLKNRSSRPEVFCKKGILRNFTKFTGNHLYQSLFLNKVSDRGLQIY